MDKQKREKIILMSIAVIVVVGFISAFSLAALKKRVDGNSGKVVYKAGDLEVILDESGASDIELVNAMPTTDEDGSKLTPYNFSIKNNGDAEICYELYLDDDTDALEECSSSNGTCNLLQDSQIKYQLVQDGSSSTKLLSTGRKLSSGSLGAGERSSYQLRVWLDYDADNSAMGKYFFGRIRVEASQCEAEPMMKAYSLGSTGDYHDSAYMNKVTSVVTKTNTTIPSTAIDDWDVSAAGDGSVIAYIEDDGTGAGTYKVTIGGNGGIVANPDSSHIFDGFMNLKSVDLSNFDTSKVTTMYNMFNVCLNLESVNLSSFNTIKVTNMGGMFSGCTALKSLDLSSFNTSNVTNMSYMFYMCTSIQTLNFGDNFDTSTATDMSYMFSQVNCIPLSLSFLDFSSATNLEGIFSYSTGTTLQLGYSDMPNVTNVANMFAYANWQIIYLGDLDTSKVTTYDNMFANCRNLQRIQVSDDDRAWFQARLNEAGISPDI